jgi:hypothetical protein
MVLMMRYRYGNKYNNVKVGKNASIKEARRGAELKLLEKAGVITNLREQVKYVLIPAQYETYERYSKKGKRLKDGVRLLERECSYIADFVYTIAETGENIVEDTKGYKGGTAYDLFVVKRKLMLAVHSIRIKEV